MFSVELEFKFSVYQSFLFVNQSVSHLSDLFLLFFRFSSYISLFFHILYARLWCSLSTLLTKPLNFVFHQFIISIATTEITFSSFKFNDLDPFFDLSRGKSQSNPLKIDRLRLYLKHEFIRWLHFDNWILNCMLFLINLVLQISCSFSIIASNFVWLANLRQSASSVTPLSLFCRFSGSPLCDDSSGFCSHRTKKNRRISLQSMIVFSRMRTISYLTLCSIHIIKSFWFQFGS